MKTIKDMKATKYGIFYKSRGKWNTTPLFYNEAEGTHLISKEALKGHLLYAKTLKSKIQIRKLENGRWKNVEA